IPLPAVQISQTTPDRKGMDLMHRVGMIVVGCVLALTVGCTQNKNSRQAAATLKPQWEAATTQPSDAMGGTSATAARANPTTTPSAAANPLAGAWQLAIPWRHPRQAAITATDATHVTIEAGKTLSGEYIVQGS